jgi:hypothetical protein
VNPSVVKKPVAKKVRRPAPALRPVVNRDIMEICARMKSPRGFGRKSLPASMIGRAAKARHRTAKNARNAKKEDMKPRMHAHARG